VNGSFATLNFMTGEISRHFILLASSISRRLYISIIFATVFCWFRHTYYGLNMRFPLLHRVGWMTIATLSSLPTPYFSVTSMHHDAGFDPPQGASHASNCFQHSKIIAEPLMQPTNLLCFLMPAKSFSEYGVSGIFTQYSTSPWPSFKKSC
jgi:hypothetical protein